MRTDTRQSISTQRILRRCGSACPLKVKDFLRKKRKVAYKRLLKNSSIDQSITTGIRRLVILIQHQKEKEWMVEGAIYVVKRMMILLISWIIWPLHILNVVFMITRGTLLRERLSLRHGVRCVHRRYQQSIYRLCIV